MNIKKDSVDKISQYLANNVQMYTEKFDKNRTFEKTENKYNTKFNIADPNEKITDKIRDEYGYIVYDNEPPFPTIEQLKDKYTSRKAVPHDYFADLTNYITYQQRVISADENSLEYPDDDYTAEQGDMYSSRINKAQQKIIYAQSLFNMMYKTGQEFIYKDELVNRLADLKAKYNIKIPKNSNSKFRTKSCYNTSINVDYILETESKLIKAKIQFKNRSKNHKLEFGLRLNTYKENELYCEDLLGITKREIDLNYNIYNEIPAKKGVELKTNVVPFNRFIYFDGVGIITYGLHSAQLNQEGLFLNLLRSTGIISNPDNPSRGTSAGPPLKAYKNYMLKDVVAKFAICFEDDVYNMYKNTNTYYRPIVCLHSDIENTQFFNVKNDSIKVLNIKIKQNILTMRLCNSKPHSNQTVIDNLFMSDKCCIYEEDIKNKSRKIIKDGIINFKPYEIKTLSVI